MVDSIMSWAILTPAILGAIAWLLIARMHHLDRTHITKAPCVWANAGHRQDWQAFATGHYTKGV